MISVQNLQFSYDADSGQGPILDISDLTINDSEYVAVIGPNGCGKTTLIRHFNAMLLPVAGQITVDGLCTADTRHLTEIRRRVGMIFQNPDNQIVGMTVEEDVAFGPCNLGLPTSEVRQRVDQALLTVGLAGMDTRSPHTLSGGQKQLLAIAGLLAMNPRFIVLDEPTSALDPAATKNVLTLLQKLKDQGIGIVHVTHNMDEAALAERVLVLHEGHLAATDNPAAIFSQVEWLQGIGLDPPQIVDLLWQLRQHGAEVDTGVLSVVEAVREITGFLEKLGMRSHAKIGQLAGR
jgi:biotin transport system ATP-binding protein/energy-coupling factor transport system ATP-binding protein